MNENIIADSSTMLRPNEPDVTSVVTNAASKRQKKTKYSPLMAQMAALRKASFTLFDPAMELIKAEDKVILALTDQFEAYRCAEDFEVIALAIAETEADQFLVTENHKGKGLWESQLGGSIRRKIEQAASILRRFPEFEFSPAAMCLVKSFQKQHLWEVGSIKTLAMGEATHEIVHRLNAAVQQTREEISTPRFRASHHNFHRAAIKNLTTLRRYVDRLFAIHGSLVVVGLELGYDNGNSGVSSFEQAFGRVSGDWLRWIRLVKKTTSTKYAGHAKRIFWGPESGFKISVILILTTRGTGSGLTLGNQLKGFWDHDITHDQGISINRCKFKSKAFHTGYGPVYGHEQNKREALDRNVQQLAKPDYFLKLQVPGRSKVFTKGDHPRLGR